MRKSGHLSWMNIVKQINGTNTRADITAAVFISISYDKLPPERLVRWQTIGSRRISLPDSIKRTGT